MENFFYDDEFYSDISALIDVYWSTDKEHVATLPDSYTMQCTFGELQPIFEFTPDNMAEMVNQERFSDTDSDNEFRVIRDVVCFNIDFDKVNALIPKLWYPVGSKFTISKQDLLASF